MLRVSGAAKSHGGRVLFKDVSLLVTPGSRVAIVGANGVGKTTLLEIVAGDQTADEGGVSRAKDTTVGYLRQEVATEPQRRLLDAVLDGAQEVRGLEAQLRELEEAVADAPAGERLDGLLATYGRAQDRFDQLGGYELEAQARRLLGGLGFAEGDLDRPVGTFSGGWMMRVALARLLLARPDVLLLDEPTNHLDLESVAWLEAFLADYDGALLLVSHDRDFINAVANKIVELAGGSATEYPGDFESFISQRQLRAEQQAAAARNQQRKIAATEDFIERFRYKASKARQVQSRVKALKKLERVATPEQAIKSVRFRFPEPARSGRDVVRLEGVAKAYGARRVYDHLDLTLERGQKAVLVGPNGAGKSTLLKLLAGELAPDSGARELGYRVTAAYFAQHHVDALHPDRTVLQELAAAMGDAGTQARKLLGAFLFTGDDVDKRVGVLSGGEKTRLALARLMCARANLLCLDEPTNHLDMASRDVLEDALAAYPGTVVLITHDRHLIRSVADTVVEVREGAAHVFAGDFEYYQSRTGRVAAGKPPAPSPAPAPATQDAQRKRTEADARNRRYRQTKDLRRRLERVEKELGRAEAEVADLTRTLAEPGIYADGGRVRELVAGHEAAKDRAATLMGEWEQLYERVEAFASRPEDEAFASRPEDEAFASRPEG